LRPRPPAHPTTALAASRGRWTHSTAPFSVHDNGDGTFKVTEEFTDGTFVTTGPVSPGACETSSHHGSTVASGVTGSFRGFLSGTVTSQTFSPAGCGGGNQRTSLLGFVGAVFGPAATFTCLEGFAGCDFNFEYDSSDTTLAYHHWQDKSSPSGEQFIGDIATPS
jgi:hypothetical protein